MFKNEPDVLTVPDVVRLLQFGKNTVYSLIKEGRIASIKQGKKIIVPKVCLVEFLTDAGNYQTPSPTVPNNLWTYEDGCDSVGVAREAEGQLQKKGARVNETNHRTPDREKQKVVCGHQSIRHRRQAQRKVDGSEP
jgi:excisionase family DNA binding protein